MSGNYLLLLLLVDNTDHRPIGTTSVYRCNTDVLPMCYIGV